MNFITISPRLGALCGPAALAAALSCAPIDEPICEKLVGAERADEADTRLLPLDFWLQVLIPLAKRAPMSVPDEPNDCGGLTITVRWPDEALQSVDPRLHAQPLPRRPISESDFTFAEGPEGSILVWARIDHYDDGTARGPVALARWVDRGVKIYGLGTLWAPHTRARLRIEPLGDDGALLVADGEICPDRQVNRCQHHIYLLPLVERRFQQVALYEGQWAGPARVIALEERRDELKHGWVRRTKIRRRIRFGEPTLRIDETLTVRECDARTEPEQCETREEQRDQRLVRWERSAFWAEKPSLWSAVEAP